MRNHHMKSAYLAATLDCMNLVLQVLCLRFSAWRAKIPIRSTSSKRQAASSVK